MARVFAQMERTRVDAYIVPIFRTYHFEVAAKWRDREDRGLLAKYPDWRITDKADLYLTDDEPLCAMYYAECDAAHRAHGFTGPAGHCPALTAEHLVMTAERLLIELGEPLCGIEADRIWGENRTKYLELLIGACTQHMKAEAKEAVRV
jgi:hypothetical protein